jgi:hypothetical protein
VTLDAIGPMENRLLQLERKQARLDAALRTLAIDATALWQREWDAWGDWPPYLHGAPTPTPTPTPTPNTGVSGTLSGCTTAGIPGTVIVTDALANVLGTFTASSGGAWSGSVYLAANAMLTFSATPTSLRFAATAISRAITAGASNVGINIAATAAAGYACTKACPYPLKTTLTLTSTGTCSGIAYPSDTLTYHALPAWLVSLGIPFGWLGSTTYNATYGAVTATWNYLFFVNSLGQLKLSVVDLAGHHSVGLATATLGSCSGSATTAAYTCSTNCATQGIGSTIHE